MAWTKLDDQFPDHPKVLAAGPLASWLYVCGLAYCGRLLTDGFIPGGQIRKLADLENAQALAGTLVEVGLWERVEGGYRVHDYLDYQPSKERVLQTREVRAEAGSKGGKQKASNLLEAGYAGATNIVVAKSYPVPVPSRIAPVYDQYPATTATSAREVRSANGVEACAFAAAVGDETFATIAGNFVGVNPQLDGHWLRATVGRFEAEGLSLPPPRMKQALKAAFLKAEDALGREGNRIGHPQAWVAKQIRTAISDEAQRQGATT